MIRLVINRDGGGALEPSRAGTLLYQRGFKAALAAHGGAPSASMNLGWTHEAGNGSTVGWAE